MPYPLASASSSSSSVLNLGSPNHDSTTSSPPTLAPATPPLPAPHLAKRHYYTCGGETLSWESIWYIEPFFTSYRASYDSAASTGPVNPPLSVIETVSRCSAALSSLSVSESEASASSASASGNGNITGTDTAARVFTTTVASVYTSDGQTRTTTYGSLTTSLPTASFTPSSTTSTPSVCISALSSPTSTAFISPSSGIITKTSTTSYTSASASSTASAAAALDPMSTNTCAGGWDWQDWGVVAGLGAGVIVGGMLWLLWGLLRGRMPGLYSPRRWFVSPDSRPSIKWSLATFLLPFLHMPSLESASAGGALLHLLFTGLKLAAVTSLLALAAGLSLILVGIPCLGQTAPANNLGGRLGTLTDLSLLRLLDALDPSPDSSATSETIRMIVQLGAKHTRSLSSTVAPAISSVRVRLIVTLVILAVLAVGGGLFTIARTYAALAKARKTYEEQTCQGMDMVVVSSEEAKRWKGMSEEGIKRSLKDWSSGTAEREDESEIRVIGVFAVPYVTELAEKIKQREDALIQLEVAETHYIDSFHLTHTQSDGDRLEPVWWTSDRRPNQEQVAEAGHENPPPEDFVAPKAFYKIGSVSRTASDDRLNVPIPASASSSAPETRFHEINRDSAMFGGRFELGQRIKLDETGQYVPDPSPDSERTHPLGSGSVDSHDALREGRPSNVSVQPPALADGAPEDQPSDSHTPHSGEAVQGLPTPLMNSSSTGSPHLRPGPARRPELHTVFSTQRHSRETDAPAALARCYADIRENRTRFKELNEEIAALQQAHYEEIAAGKQVRGWILVGRGARWLPFAQIIEGGTREDILWDHAGSQVNESSFWTKIITLGVILGVIMIPFLALTVGTAPGFAHYLGLVRPLVTSDGFGSGVVEGFVPAVVIALIVGVTLYATERCSRQVRTISRSHQKFMAYKATFWLLLATTVIWLRLVIALEYAVQGFATNVQKARTVGDGAVYSTWFIFILLLNLAFILPALHLLQPKRLVHYIFRRPRAITPRQRFRLLFPPSSTPSYALAPCLLAVFYACTILFIFRLLALPILVLLYLSFMANRYMSEHVLVDSCSSHLGTTIGLWTVRRFGWILPLQPALYGLILFSRNEWTLGGISLGVAVVAVILSELLTVVRYPSARRRELSPKTRKALDDLRKTIHNPPSNPANPPNQTRQTRTSDLSLLNRITALLPTYSRLPPGCPLPFTTEQISDLRETERAAYANPSLTDRDYPDRSCSASREVDKGLIYPPELLATVPVIWLPCDRPGVAESELMDLQVHHGLSAILDPLPDSQEDEVKHRHDSKGLRRRRGQQPMGEVESPLLS